MRSLRFEHIWLLSRRDQKARSEKFHPKRNLILGRNHTGKSTLIRSIFETLGANPSGHLESWDNDAISALQFRVDEATYIVIRQRNNRALLDSDGQLILATGSWQAWSKHFAVLMGFNLVFTGKAEEQATPADPACFFLPFYINQDGSWQAEWNTFQGLRRFKAPWGAILEYFAGVVPPEYYKLKADRAAEEKRLEETTREFKLLERTRERFKKTVPLDGPKLRPEDFKQEITRLTRQVTDLNSQQEILRSKSVAEEELISNLNMQVQLAADALLTYDSDTAFIRQEGAETLKCPTCGAEHLNSFMDLLQYAEDARVLLDLTIRLREDVRHAEAHHAETVEAISALDSQYRLISETLSSRKGEMQFSEVLNNVGAENAFRAFEVEANELRASMDQSAGTVYSIDHRLKELRDSKRTKRILNEFRVSYSGANGALNLPALEGSRVKLSSRPKLSGSGGPRSILAYYAAIWKVCHSADAPYSVPIVIDSPNQQGQDDVNLPAVLKFIAEDLPEDMQLIVGLETPSDYHFDREIVLNEKYSLLQPSAFATVDSELRPWIETMYRALLNESPSAAVS